jgi:hypothetical protein
VPKNLGVGSIYGYKFAKKRMEKKPAKSNDSTVRRAELRAVRDILN